jgi:hypothetical protein
MTRALAGTVLTLVAIGVAGADVTKERDEGKAVAVKLAGEWASNGVFNGESELDVLLNSGEPYIVFKFTGDGYTKRIGNNVWKGQLLSACIVKGAGEINLGFALNVQRGIVQFDGADTLTLCLAPPGEDRPTEFKVKKDSGQLLMVLKRVKR